MKQELSGIIVPILTPLDAQENVDEARLRRQVDFVIEGGVNGILLFGSNGEFYMAEEDEMTHCLDVVIEQTAGRVPVYFGIGAIRTGKCIRLARMARDHGADAISVLQPMFLKPTEDELYQHFRSIAESVPELPMLLYNNPGRTGYTLSANLVERLADVANIAGMKDSSGDLTQTEEFIRRTADEDFRVFAGKDTLIYASLCVGAAGAVCTTANFLPELVSEIYRSYRAGDTKASLAAQFRLNPIRLSMDKASFPVATKDMANMRGMDVAFAENGLRGCGKAAGKRLVSRENGRGGVVPAGAEIALCVAEGRNVKIMLQNAGRNDHVADGKPRRKPACNAGVDDGGGGEAVDQKLCAARSVDLADPGLDQNDGAAVQRAGREGQAVKRLLLFFRHGCEQRFQLRVHGADNADQAVFRLHNTSSPPSSFPVRAAYLPRRPLRREDRAQDSCRIPSAGFRGSRPRSPR